MQSSGAQNAPREGGSVPAPPHPEEAAQRSSRRTRRPHGSRRAQCAPRSLRSKPRPGAGPTISSASGAYAPSPPAAAQGGCRGEPRACLDRHLPRRCCRICASASARCCARPSCSAPPHPPPRRQARHADRAGEQPVLHANAHQAGLMTWEKTRQRVGRHQKIHGGNNDQGNAEHIQNELHRRSLPVGSKRGAGEHRYSALATEPIRCHARA